MISEIKMKNCATFGMNGGTISGCTKVNFLYGANGSGKSTVSEFLRNQEDSRFQDSAIMWGSDNHADIVVYNRKFKDANFGASDIPGVFTLGEGTIDELTRIDELKQKHGDLLRKKEQFIKHKNIEEERLKEKEENFQRQIWAAKSVEHMHVFRKAFSGLLNSKEKFKEEALLQFGKGVSCEESYELLKSKAETVYVASPVKASEYQMDFLPLTISASEIEKNSVWQEIIIGKEDLPIGKLIKKLESAMWVNSGRKYISVGDVCPFCQSAVISQELKTQMDEFFCGEYNTKTEQISNLIADYKSNKVQIESTLDNVKKDADLNSIGKIDQALLEKNCSKLIKTFDENIKIMENKKAEPERKVSLFDIESKLIPIIQVISAANDRIKAHNEVIDNIKTEQAKLSNSVWKYFLNENLVLIETYQKEKTDIEKAIRGLEERINKGKEEIEGLEKSIIELEKNITSTQPTVDEINRMLKAYGFTNFSIVPSSQKENSYQIQRQNGDPVYDTLSEGEETFITFLYFMQLVKGASESGGVNRKKIVVLDDPICSLDSTVLYIVSAMVKDMKELVLNNMSDVEQIFVLTHNVYFHKEASYNKRRNQKDTNVHFWIIRKINDVSLIFPYGEDNPIKTSYELLWKELREDTMANSIVIQNVMRRIIENYFNMVGNVDDFLINRFDSVEEQIICRSLLCWLNDGSHSIPDDIFIDSNTPSIEKYKDVFRLIFEKTNNIAHYNMMMGISDSL